MDGDKSFFRGRPSKNDTSEKEWKQLDSVEENIRNC